MSNKWRMAASSAPTAQAGSLTVGRAAMTRDRGPHCRAGAGQNIGPRATNTP